MSEATMTDEEIARLRANAESVRALGSPPLLWTTDVVRLCDALAEARRERDEWRSLCERYEPNALEMCAMFKEAGLPATVPSSLRALIDQRDEARAQLATLRAEAAATVEEARRQGREEERAAVVDLLVRELNEWPSASGGEQALTIACQAIEAGRHVARKEG
jgi:hypothetical protein